MKDLYAITGFLGSGKTTFINMAAQTFAGKHIAVIVNEFGKQGVDGSLFSGKGFNVTEITNGSIFCVCRSDMFIEALIQAEKTAANVIFTETSGLSNPANIEEILTQATAIGGVSFNYKGCICLIDALNFQKVYKTAVVIPDQIKQSSLVVINKIDLAGNEKTTESEKIIRTLNPSCTILRTSYADMPKELFATLKPIKEKITGGKQDLLSTSLTFRIAEKCTVTAFRNLLKDIAPYIYRCKGFVSLKEGFFFAEGIMDEFSVSPAVNPGQNGVVLLFQASNHVKKLLLESAKVNNIIIEVIG